MLRKHRHRTGNQMLVREINLATVMNALHRESPLSRASLAEMTGLNKTTVSSLVQELIDTGFIHEIGFNSAGAGRPSVLLEFNPAAGFIVSAEIGVDFVSVICTDFAVKSIWQHRQAISHPTEQTTILNLTLNLMQTGADAVRGRYPRLLGVAVGVPGLVDQTSGELLFAPNLGWQNVPLKQFFAEAFDVPVVVNNEANLSVLGEYFFGAAQGVDDVLYVSAGVGLGGAVIHGGQLFNGGAGFAGEFGHMTMDPTGEPCNCGNTGCWETQVSQSALFRAVRRAGRLGALTGSQLDELTVPQIVSAAAQQDAVALDALAQVGRHLGVGIASLVNAFNPNLVVFGGILCLAADYLLPVINTELQQRALLWNQSAVRVVPARYGSDACVIGGAAAIYQSILDQPAVC